MRVQAIVALALLVPTLSAGCSGGDRNEMTVVVEYTSVSPPPGDIEAWLRIASVRGDVKFNEAVLVGHDEEAKFSMGDLQGPLRFTAIVGDHTHSEEEQMEPDEDWHIAIRSDGSTCFRFGIDGTGPMRCG